MNKNKKQQVSAPTSKPTPSEMRSLIRSMLRGLMGDEDRTLELSVRIPYTEIPADLAFEADVLRVLYICSDKEITPTPENITTGLAIHCKRSGDETIAAMSDLALINTDGNVKFISRWLDDYLKQIRIENAAAQVSLVVTSTVGTTDERYEQAVQILGGVAGVSDSAITLSDKQRRDAVMSFFHENTEKIRTGAPLGPSLMLKGFTGEKDAQGNVTVEGAIPSLAWGDVTIISALRGNGKSTVAGALAEHNAWRLGFDVLFIHLETDHREMEIRSIARNLRVRASHLRSAPVTADKRLMEGIEKFFEWRDTRPGQIEYCFCPGWDVFRVENAIRAGRMRAEERGKELVVFIDYLGKLDESLESDGSAHLMKQISARIKNITQRENAKSPVHTFLFSQETQNTTTGKAYTYGSQAVLDSGQVYISLQRESSAKENAIHSDNDFFGKPRWLHQRGQASSTMVWHVLKANSAATGVKVMSTIEGALYRVGEPVIIEE